MQNKNLKQENSENVKQTWFKKKKKLKIKGDNSEKDLGEGGNQQKKKKYISFIIIVLKLREKNYVYNYYEKQMFLWKYK